MGGLRWIRAQVRADWAVVAVLASVLAVSGAVGAVAPGWVKSTLDSALVTTIRDSAAELRRNEWTTLDAEGVEREFHSVIGSEPILGDVFTPDRWTVSTREGFLNGTLNELIDIRMPRDFENQVDVVEGAMPSTVVEYDEELVAADEPTIAEIEVLMSEPVADMFDLTLGDTVEIVRVRAPASGTTYGIGPKEDRVAAHISGIFEPVDRDWSGWLDSRAAVEPFERRALGGVEFHGAFLADPAVIEDVSVATNTDLFAQWVLRPEPVEALSVDASSIVEALRRVEALGEGWSTPMDDDLVTHVEQRDSAGRVSAFGASSLAALILIVMVLSLRLLAARRRDAVVLARTRGSSTRVLVRLLLAEGALIAVPATVIGAIIGLWLSDLPWSKTAAVGPAVIALLATIGLPVAALATARRGRVSSPDNSAMRPSAQRLVADIGVVLIAAAAMWLLTNKSASGAGIDPVVSLTPVLVAIAAGIVTFRVVPLLMSATMGWSRRWRGAASFISVARAGRPTSSVVLPVVAILAAVGLSALGASLNSTAERERVAASWQEVPADYVVTDMTNGTDAQNKNVSGVDLVAWGYQLPSTSGIREDDGASLRGPILAVELDTWQEITSRSPEPVPVVDLLASSTQRAPAVVIGNPTSLGEGDSVVIGDVQATVVGNLPVFPGVSESPTLIVPAEVIDNQLTDVAPTVAFIAGGAVDASEVAAEFGGDVISRFDVLAEIDAAPMLHATRDIYRIAFYAATVLVGVAAVLSILLAARPRARTLSVLHTLGLTKWQATAIVLVEVMPPVIMAAIVGVGVGAGVTIASSQALDLAVLTTTLNSDTPIVLDITRTAAIAAGVVGVVLIAVAATITASHRTRLSAIRTEE